MRELSQGNERTTKRRKMIKTNLMWVGALLPENIARDMVTICKEENHSAHLSEDMFKYPLYVSLNESFMTDNYDTTHQAILDFIHAHGPITCHMETPAQNTRRVYLPVTPTGDIITWHNEFDHLLDNLHIDIDDYDRHYDPHVTLFRGARRLQCIEMQRLLFTRIPAMDLTLNRFVIEASHHEDEYITL